MYTIENDTLVMIVTDRISAFDVILPKEFPIKDKYWNQIANKFWMQLPYRSQLENGIARSNGYRRYTCEPYKVEMVIRGYLAGSAWREYKGVRSIVRSSPDGMKRIRN